MTTLDLELTYTTSDGVSHSAKETDGCLAMDVSWGQRNVITVSAKEPVTLLSAAISIPHAYEKDERIFVNGYQSWTDTREFTAGESLKDITKLPKFLVNMFSLDGYGDSTFKKYRKKVLHGYDVSWAKDFFAGSFNSANAYLIINHDVMGSRIVLESDISGLQLPAGGSICLFDFTLDKDFWLSMYPVKDIPDILGYTSWYNYYENINEEKILSSLEQVGEPYELFQIDDGYESAVGDWLSVDPMKFPNGLEGIVQKIHAKGLKAGIWLAPFAAESKSQVYKEHPDWFFDWKAGGNWSGFYGLNSNNGDAMAYVEQCLRRYADMGFDFFKLDFLYAVNPRKITTRTRAQISGKAYEMIRRTLPDKLILGCGAMIMNSTVFDYLRIGPDVSLKFDDVWYMKYMHRERVSTKVTLQNTIYRSFMDKRLFGCDPDVFILRNENNCLSREQKEALITINALFGSVMMTSDNVSAYTAEQQALFSKALLLRNATDKSYSSVDGRHISISYTLGVQKHRLTYDTMKGILQETK
ncbi:MAG: alpha-galactosidase [Clostridia bacterium]|nr:alpha-galactosidase [Clostridia bacterium]